MRIGLFTDTYRPAQNGVVLVVDVTRRELEKMGHEVWVFAPSANILNEVSEIDAEDDHLIHFPTIRGAGFKEGQLPLFYSPHLLSKVQELKIDILHFFTAGQMAMFCCYAARKTGTTLIGQHCTDTYEYSDSYRLLKVGYAAMATLMPLAVNMSREQRLDFVRNIADHKSEDSWGRRLVGNMLALWYQACDEVIAVSEKSANQLREISASNNCSINLTTIPTGVNQPRVPDEAEIDAFCATNHINRHANNLIYFGRLGQEKNLDLLIPVIERVRQSVPDANLIFAGDWEYRTHLEELAAASPAHDHIYFVGRYPHRDVGILTAISKIYLFPSLTDTQGLAVTEAAYGGLPIVLCDPLAPACFIDHKNGYTAQNDAADFADKIVDLLQHPVRYRNFSNCSKRLAAELTETKQTEKIVEVYRQALKRQ